MFSLGEGRGMDWWEKLTVQICGRALVKPRVAASFGSPNVHTVDCASFQPLKSQHHPSRPAQTLASA